MKMRRVKETDVLYVMQILEEHIPVDSPHRLGVRVNDQGIQCIRCQGTTRGIDWLVDIYGKHFFYVSIPPRGSVTFDSLKSLVLFLKSILTEVNYE